MLVIGDLHLTRHTPRAVSDDLARLLADHAGTPVVLAGDFFDLSTDAPYAERREAIDGVFAVHESARSAVGRHLDSGGELILLGGNHDADLGQRDIGPALLDAVGPEPGGPRPPDHLPLVLPAPRRAPRAWPPLRPGQRPRPSAHRRRAQPRRALQRRVHPPDRRPPLPAEQRRNPAEAVSVVLPLVRPPAPPTSSTATSTPPSPR